MKKGKGNGASTKKKTVKIAEDRNQTEVVDKIVASNSLDDDDKGFGGWLRSTDGLETMKLFIIANSIVILTTITFPHIQKVYEIIYEMIYGPDSLY